MHDAHVHEMQVQMWKPNTGVLQQPMVPTVHRHHIHFRKHNGQPQINYLNAFINLFGH